MTANPACGSPSTFARFFGNRGFFPASHQEGARRELADVLRRLGHPTLLRDVGVPFTALPYSRCTVRPPSTVRTCPVE